MENEENGISIEEKKAKTECGVFACISKDPSINIANTIFQGLIALQHRGQEAAGITVVDNHQRLHTLKNHGLVFDALSQGRLQKMWGNIGIGHVRYGTAGSGDLRNAQPFYFETTQTPPFAIVFNGNITNYQVLKERLQKKGKIFMTDVDTEVIANIIASNYTVTDNWVENLEFTAKLLDGSYSLILLTNEQDLYCYRSGNKPLVIGQTQINNSLMYLISSESCAISTLGGEVIRDVKPGEIIHVHRDHFFHTEKILDVKPNHCVFEYIYFARADSIIDGISVHGVRERMGEILARENPVVSDNAIVVPVPDSGRSAAIGFSRASGIPYKEGLMKNRYVYRSFIAPNQAERMNLVRMKLNPVEDIVKGREVILVDDSIVRGTTLQRIAQLVRDAGAVKVHLRSSSPPIAYPCFYGVDFASIDELIYGALLSDSLDETLDKIREHLKADSLGYLSIEGLIEAIGMPRENLCLACLNGEYWASHEETKKYLTDGRI